MSCRRHVTAFEAGGGDECSRVGVFLFHLEDVAGLVWHRVIHRVGEGVRGVGLVHQLELYQKSEHVGVRVGEKAGKVRWLGLSEAGPKSLARACKIHPITALQSEYSLWARDVEDEVLPACRELGIASVAVTAGYMHDAPRREFYAKMDAANVDLKGFTEVMVGRQAMEQQKTTTKGK